MQIFGRELFTESMFMWVIWTWQTNTPDNFRGNYRAWGSTNIIHYWNNLACWIEATQPIKPKRGRRINKRNSSKKKKGESRSSSKWNPWLDSCLPYITLSVFQAKWLQGVEVLGFITDSLFRKRKSSAWLQTPAAHLLCVTCSGTKHTHTSG